MKSSKMVSFISWNSKDYLQVTLDNMVKDLEIYFYFFIFHKKEDDDLSDHYHVIIYPSKPLDYNDIKNKFIQPQKYGLPPLGISARPNYVAKNCDYEFLLYILHEPRYIKLHCAIAKKYTYSSDLIVTNDIRTFSEILQDAFTLTDFARDKTINDLINQGTTPSELIDNGYIPIKEACAYHHYIQMKKGG